MRPNTQTRRSVLRQSGIGIAAGMGVVSGCLAKLSGVTGTTVTMTGDLRFVPAEATIQSGESVTWKNESGAPHTVSPYEESLPENVAYFASGGYESEQAVRQTTSARGFLVRGETYQYTFEVPGTYRYFCLPHEKNGMIGTVIVE